MGYPYFDLESSIEVAEVIHNRGGGQCSIDQLAAWLGYSTVKSGTFATRLSSARYYGLITAVMDGRIAITIRARAILAPVMPEDAASAKADAFLAVPLYEQIFERFRGSSLPPDVGLSNLLIHSYQIVPDRVGQAVSVFRRSAEQAGFFREGNTRLIRPTTTPIAGNAATHPEAAVPAAADIPLPEQRRSRFAGGGGGDGPQGVHPGIVGLLRELPAPGTPWTATDQKGFLDAFTAMVKFIYPAKGEADGA